MSEKLHQSDLVTLSDEEKVTLSLLIATQDHRLFTLIHPICYLWSKGERANKLINVLTHHQLSPDEFAPILQKTAPFISQDDKPFEYLQSLLLFLQSNDEPVLLLGEDTNQMHQTIPIVRRQGYTGSILYYNTASMDPYPAQGNIRSIVTALNELGVKQLTVGGQYVRQNYRGKRSTQTRFSVSGNDLSILDGCVPGFINLVLNTARNTPPTTIGEVNLSPLHF